MRTCPRCGETKLITEFYVNKSRPTGRSSHCAVCDRAYQRARYYAVPDRVRAISRRNHLKSNYGITPEQYDAMLDAQGGVCAICRSSAPDKRWGRFQVDHCHTSSLVRGLLCSPCNRGIGHFRDNPAHLRAAADYLDRNAA